MKKPSTVLEHLKIELNDITELLYHHNYNDYQLVNKKLAACMKATFVNQDTDKITRYGDSCGKPFCPFCNYFKIIREYAIAYSVLNKLRNMEINHVNKLLTLTIPRFSVNEFVGKLSLIKKLFRALFEKKMVKDDGTKVSFQASNLGYSLYFHIQTNDEYSVFDSVGLHIHAIMIQKASFSSYQSITKKMVQKYWAEIVNNRLQLASVTKIETDFKTFKLGDLPKVVGYCVNKFTIGDLIKTPEKTIALLPQLHKQRFSSHAGCIKVFRKEVQEDYCLKTKSNNNQYAISPDSPIKDFVPTNITPSYR